VKILELRFKNLNSLYGEWRIDFTEPEYVANGIFALTGPTGAGKSTILDALCLGLYGATPRLGKITSSGNEIMSRQTGECYAEVVFESQGERFRCHWEQRRARKSSEGKLQNQEHQIAEADSGILIETKKSLVTRVIEEKTGMDFDRFTRSILLAQGRVDTFLKADAEQKSKILEQITGTEIYSEISRRVHERQRGEREVLNELKGETKGIELLDPEQEKEISKELESWKNEEVELKGQLKKSQNGIDWLEKTEALKSRLQKLEIEATDVNHDLVAFQPEMEKLLHGNSAALLEGSYATLRGFRHRQAEDQTSLETQQKALPDLELKAKKQILVLESAEKHAEKAKFELVSSAPVLNEVRSLDQKIETLRKAIVETEDICRRDADVIQESDGEIVEKRKRQSGVEKQLESAKGFLKEHATDEWLVGGLAGIEEQLRNIDSRQTDISRFRERVGIAEEAGKRAKKNLVESQGICEKGNSRLEEAAKKLQQEQDELTEFLEGRLLREYRQEKENLQKELVYLARISELEEHRTKLADGIPCPLCGAENHPFAEGNIPVPDEAESRIAVLSALIGKAEEKETAINELKQAEDKIRKQLSDSEKLQATAETEMDAAREKLSDLNENLGLIQFDFTRLEKSVLLKLEPLGIKEIPGKNDSSLLGILQNRLDAWSLHLEKKSKCEVDISSLESKINQFEAIAKTQRIALGEKQERLTILREELQTKSRERFELFAEKDPADEEVRLNKAIKDADDSVQHKRESSNSFGQELEGAKSAVKALVARLEEGLPKLKNLEEDFSDSLQPLGFADEKEFLAAQLSVEERQSLTRKAEALADAQTRVKALQKENSDQLENEAVKKVTDQTLEELKPLLENQKLAHEKQIETVTRLSDKLDRNIKLKESLSKKQTIIDARKKELEKWDKLHSLIGSADGKKFRNFAQGLTFELMVSHANIQLSKMTDRYLLIRDDTQPLELNVIDNYQAGEIRSTRNLSGGESFIVSLTLALGLSKMASRKVRVDSLFLDEGFGTLDEEALETALETLSGLQHDGKLIGVISHVPALKERISTQISVEPGSGGKSTIVGPGCSRL